MKNTLMSCLFCLLFILISIIIFPFQKTDNKSNISNSKKKVESKDIINNRQDYGKEKDDIEPPEEEDWIESGDKELYTLKMNCITPKTGITGGTLIYFGIYVKPPYELRIVDNTLLINNLPFYGPLEFRKKLSERWMAKIKEKTILSDKEKEYFSRLHKVVEEIKNKHDLLIAKFKDDYDTKTTEIIKDLDNFLKNHPEIDYYKIYPGIYIEFKIKNRLFESLYSVELRKTLRTIRDPETDPPANENDKNYLESLLKDSFVEKYPAEMITSFDNERYIKAAYILKSDMKNIDKIKYLFKLYNNIYKAKLVYYNFNYYEFLE